MELKLRGRRVLITGASKGIGAAAAEVFAAEGCHLALAARNKSALSVIADSLRTRHGVEVEVVVADLRKQEDIAALAVRRVDVLINNAGDIPGGSIEKVDEQAWRHGWELKVFGYINLTRLVYAAMKSHGGGVIINNIGNGGERFDSNYIAGSSGNAALMAFTRALGGRSLEDKIRVVGINPGPVETDRIVDLMKAQARARFSDESRYKALLTNFPSGRAAKPSEIADMMAFLASERSGYTSGTIVTIDGGMSARPG
jgi:NAD(P)-dependent dehydrogenase (short-subunit alcohol dehydrogenase family)